jgi:hypothetical protein
MSALQFVAVAFTPGGRRYTYHHGGEPVTVGDRVLVPARGGGTIAVTVEAILDGKPDYETKPIIGLAPADDDPPPLAA